MAMTKKQQAAWVLSELAQATRTWKVGDGVLGVGPSRGKVVTIVELTPSHYVGMDAKLSDGYVCHTSHLRAP